MGSEYEMIVLFEGFSKLMESGKEMLANCTCTLIKGPKNIIVDTMTAWDGDKIVGALEKHNLKPADIEWVVCTHGHSDHIGNNSLFQNATHIVGYSISKREKYMFHPFDKGIEYVIDDKIRVIPTPGHTMTDVTVIVKIANNGIIAITGDLFEKEEDLQDENIWLNMAGSESPELQRVNRKKILNVADYIVPGHGPLFTVDKKFKNNPKPVL